MKRRKKWGILLPLFGLLLALMPPTYTEAGSVKNSNPPVSARAAAVIDVETGRILYEKSGNTQMRIASLTKIMTAIVAIEEGKLNDVVEVPSHAVGTEGSSIYLRHGEKLTLEQLLYGLMLRSGNDAAVTIAEHVGGSVPGFVQLMNEKAAYLGLSNSHFANPHGLDQKDHYSTADDLAKLTAYALHNEEFRKIVGTKTKTIPQEGQSWDRKLMNKNKMLVFYEGADGVKTGYTKLAKRCLVSSATRDGRQIAVVTLNDPNDWQDHAMLLDYGFKRFDRVQLVSKGEKVAGDFITLQPFYYPLAANEKEQIRKTIAGGFLQIYLGDTLIGKVTLGKQAQQTSSRIFDRFQTERFFTVVKEIIWGGLIHG
jgi:serine-type D-Ala-D-Ala carboxypeptidase (penicillin-binding protein 5/6)